MLNQHTIATNIGFTEQDFSDLLVKDDYPFSPGDVVAGTVLSLEPRGALIDIGAKVTAYLPIVEMSIHQFDSPDEILQPNETREFLIQRDQNEHGLLTLSIRRLEERRTWERLRQMQQEDATVLCVVFATNRDGGLVQIEGLQGFVPNSHISTRKPPEELVGEKLQVKFLEVDEDSNRLVLSHRVAMVSRKVCCLEVGECMTGTVRGIKPYGVFIDIGGVSGLISISEISHEFIDSPHSVFKVGDQVVVLILDLDAERGRIFLSTKQLEHIPGDMLRNPQQVFEKAEEMACQYRERLQSQHI